MTASSEPSAPRNGIRQLSAIGRRATATGHAAANKALRKVGLEIDTTATASWNAWSERVSNETRRRILARRSIDLLVDVGANTGGYGISARTFGYRGPIVSFEPLAQCQADLATLAATNGPWTIIPKAVGSEPGSIDIHVAGNSLSSSVLPMLDRHADAAPESRYVSTETVEVVRLDDALRAAPHSQGRHLWTKIDTQGFEASVIAGAGETLARSDVLELELSFVPLYDGQLLFPDMVALVGSHGFVLHAMNEVFVDPATDQLLQVDGIFVRS